MTGEILTGVCSAGCGAGVQRRAVPGSGMVARIANRMPLVCDACDQHRSGLLETEAVERAERQASMSFRGRLEASGMAARLRMVDLDALDREGCGVAIDRARDWAARQIPGLLLTGGVGTGKTTVAAGGLLQRLRVASGRWVSAPVLLARLGAGLGSQERERALDALSGRRALVIDDIDKARPSEYAAEQIFLAVDNAVTNGQALLVTSNLDPGGLAVKWPEPYGDAIASRLVGYCVTVPVTGSDRRLGGRS